MATSTATDRVYNFSSGPAVMPVPVLEQIQHDLVSLPGVGMSILEVSHRSKVFEGVIAKAEADLRALANIPSNYKVLFLQGGASLQFSMVPMNLLLPGDDGRLHHHRDRGPRRRRRKPRRWAPSTSRRRPRPTTSAASRRRPRPTLTQGAAYVHITSNNTIEGTQWHSLPDVGNAPLISDASSDILSRPIDVSAYGLIYAGAQKNLGPSGDDGRDHPGGLAGAVGEDAAHDAELRGARRERLAVQHAAVLPDLRRGPRAAVAEGAGRTGGSRAR